MKIGFDSEKYQKVQSEKIIERIKMFDNKLYLEFGGKLFDDTHAKRVLPGFELDSKVRLLKELKDITEISCLFKFTDISGEVFINSYNINNYDDYSLFRHGIFS